ncbi:hypothetical protein [Microvirga tunisiensis]|uniref:hypothetical protein n=1 Tax=Microvirga tunisiensis TaxID=2108360 RepID=UPI00192D3E86|nr:hypothetical protein [Microvirga tunisiensis]
MKQLTYVELKCTIVEAGRLKLFDEIAVTVGKPGIGIGHNATGRPIAGESTICWKDG